MADAWEVVGDDGGEAEEAEEAEETAEEEEEEEDVLVVVEQKEEEEDKGCGAAGAAPSTTPTTSNNIGSLVQAIASDVALLQRDFAEVVSPCPAASRMQGIESSIRRIERRLDEIERVVANVQHHQLVSQNHHHQQHRGAAAGTPQHNLFQSLSDSVSNAVSFK
jgi:hypothetical protein